MFSGVFGVYGGPGDGGYMYTGKGLRYRLASWHGSWHVRVCLGLSRQFPQVDVLRGLHTRCCWVGGFEAWYGKKETGSKTTAHIYCSR